jgi:creatinine amidohydrolase
MSFIREPVAVWVALLPLVACGGTAPVHVETPASFLETMTWQEAERALTPDTIVVIPIGAAAKEHGPHLRLANDWIMADDLRRRLAARTPVVVAPIVGLSYYPAFVEYPGSIGLGRDTARDVIVEVVRSVARHGPRRFYALNTGVSTLRALRPAAEVLAAEGIVLQFTDLIRALGPIEHQLAQQEGGTHADEIETSMMLYIAPDTVDMTRAVKDYRPVDPQPAGPRRVLADRDLGRPDAGDPRQGRAHRARAGRCAGGRRRGAAPNAAAAGRNSTRTRRLMIDITGACGGGRTGNLWLPRGGEIASW